MVSPGRCIHTAIGLKTAHGGHFMLLARNVHTVSLPFWIRLEILISFPLYKRANSLAFCVSELTLIHLPLSSPSSLVIYHSEKEKCDNSAVTHKKSALYMSSMAMAHSTTTSHALFVFRVILHLFDVFYRVLESLE